LRNIPDPTSEAIGSCFLLGEVSEGCLDKWPTDYETMIDYRNETPTSLLVRSKDEEHIKLTLNLSLDSEANLASYQDHSLRGLMNQLTRLVIIKVLFFQILRTFRGTILIISIQMIVAVILWTSSSNECFRHLRNQELNLEGGVWLRLARDPRSTTGPLPSFQFSLLFQRQQIFVWPSLHSTWMNSSWSSWDGLLI
jgi:hypothetical protein